MAGFTDLLPLSQPAYYGAGCFGGGTEGATWSNPFDFIDTDGNPIDLTSATGSCTIYTASGGSTVTTLTVTGGVGTLTVSKTAAATVGLANGLARRECVWGCTVTLSGTTVQLWTPANSTFVIYSGD